MILEASDQCNQASFLFGETTDTRDVDIKVTQYECGNEMGGPPDCLQFHTGSTGFIQSFNFPTGSTVGSTGKYILIILLGAL